MTKEYIDLANEVYDISAEFKTLCSLIDTLHVAMSGDQALDNDTIMAYTGNMQDHADDIRVRLFKVINKIEEDEGLHEKGSAWLEALVSLIEVSRDCTADQIDKAVKALQNKG